MTVPASSGTAAMSALFEPGRIGSLVIPNRVVRAGTSETLADDRGGVTRELINIYSALADGGVGLILTGHLYCERRGQYARRQAGIYGDDLLPGLQRLTGAVHERGGLVFAQLAHAGSQSRVDSVQTWAPSEVANALTGRAVAAATEAEIEDAIAAFAQGATRAVAAGFDGVHIHAANGYLISEFSSPLTNRRSDEWGGSAAKRDRFAMEVVKAVRSAVPAELPVTMKLGVVDAVPGGLELEESLGRAERLVGLGLDGLEISCNVMHAAADSAHKYVAVGPRRSVEDLLIHRVLSPAPAPAEAYFLPWADAVRRRVKTVLILVGGLRRVRTMETVLSEGHADFVALARPLIREPDLVAQLRNGRTGQVACTSCNLCLEHEGLHGLRCWRTPRRRLLQHAGIRLVGGLAR
jgi:2,4-dienoyl-CoA reductase-like NADH-dependent reductase (Old Yellow Enzyme family)